MFAAGEVRKIVAEELEKARMDPRTGRKAMSSPRFVVLMLEKGQ